MELISKVLIVDDEPIARESLEALLAGEAYDLYFAGSGVEGLAKAAVVRPDAVLLDVMMPGMDGFEVCRRLRSAPKLEQVAIIMITALDDRASRLAGLRAGADEFLSKPFDSVELKTRLQTIAHLGRYRRLIAERTRFEWMVEQSEEGYLVLDANGLLQYANPRASALLVLTELDLGRPFLEVAQRFYRLEPIALWQQWAETGAFPGPCFMVQPETVTARAFWLRADGMDLPDAGSVGRVVRLHDVTSQMSNYQDMRRFHTSVVHKLRTPLIAMHGSFSLLASYGNEMSGAEVEEFARTALQGIERLKGEIDDVLQYINAPVLAISGETIQLQQLPEKAVEIGAQLGVEHIAVIVPPGMDEVSISLTPQALDTILWELFENSTKFHPDHAPKVDVIVTQTDANALTLLIRDDGVTLSPEQLRWVWTPYIQGEKYFTGEAPGMGLGLALVAALIWHVGGEVALNNRNDGPGVEVWLHLPTFEE